MINLLSVTVVAAIAAACAFVVGATSYNEAGGAIVIGLAMLITGVFVLPQLVGREDRQFMQQLIYVAVAAKIVVAVAFVLLFEVVIGTGLKDTVRYSNEGGILADLVRGGDMFALVNQFGFGTEFMDYFTGVIFIVTGNTLWGGFAVFSLFGLLGSLLYYRAFVTAVPQGKTRLYAVLVFMFPAILFWTSPIGKDALTFLFVGIVAYSASILWTRQKLVAIIPLVVGTAGTFLVRPEVAIMIAATIFPALALWSLRGPVSGMGRRLLVLIFAISGLAFGAVILQPIIGIEGISVEAVVEVLVEETQNEFDTTGDGSNFVVTPVGSKAWVPMAFATTLFRPFPGELVTIQGIVESGEGMVLAGVLLFNFTSVLRGVAAARREPYMLYSVLFSIAAIIFLSTIPNFGLLARMRIIMFPALFAIAAYRPASRLVNAQHPAPGDHERSDPDPPLTATGFPAPAI